VSGSLGLLLVCFSLIEGCTNVLIELCFAQSLIAWASFINSISAAPLSDLILTFIVLGFFSLLFAFGVLPYGRVAGIACIGLVGGTAFGVRVVILKSGLLISGSTGYIVNWVLVGFFGLAGGMSIIWEQSQRGGLVRTLPVSV
jgi:hypothetical protein